MKYFFIVTFIFVLVFIGCQKNQEQKIEKLSPAVNITEKYCFVRDVKNREAKDYATIDFIDYLKTSDVDSSVVINHKIDLPNNYSYVNREVDSQIFEITDSAKIVLQTFSFNEEGNFNFNQTVKLTELEDALKNKNEILFFNSPFKVKLENDKIIELTEIYIP